MPVVSHVMLRKLQYYLGSNRSWPMLTRMMLLSYGHLNAAQRSECTVFLLGNGVPPYVIEEFYTSRFRFDEAAWDQIHNIISNFPTSRLMYWDVALGRRIMSGPRRVNPLDRDSWIVRVYPKYRYNRPY